MVLLHYTLSDWLRKLALLSQPIRRKTKTNPDLLARVFPHLTLITCICFYFWLVLFPFCYPCIRQLRPRYERQSKPWCPVGVLRNALGSRFRLRFRGPFLETPDNFPGPVSIFLSSFIYQLTVIIGAN